MSNSSTLNADAPTSESQTVEAPKPESLANRWIQKSKAIASACKANLAKRRKRSLESWREAGPGTRFLFCSIMAASAVGLYYVGTLAHDYAREQRYAYLTPKPVKISGILPDNAQISIINIALSEYIKTLIPNRPEPPLLILNGKRPIDVFPDEPIPRKKQDEIDAMAKRYPYVAASLMRAAKEDAAMETYKSMPLPIPRAAPEPSFTAMEFLNTGNLDGAVNSLVIFKLADGTLAAKSASSRPEIVEMDDQLVQMKAISAKKLIKTGDMVESEQANLTSLAIRLGDSDLRAYRNIKAILFAALNVAMVFLMLGIAFALLRRSGGKEVKFILPAKIKGSIDDLIGMEDIKAEVMRAQDFLSHRELYKEYGVDRPANILFSGPPGTGKTKLAGYLAKALDLPILFHSAANLETGFVNGGSQTLETALAMAKKHKRCIIFLDEAQDLFMKRGQSGRKFDDDTQNTLLSILDGVRTTDESEVIWIVASNFNSLSMDQDEAMLRRFPMKVDFRLPNADERSAIMEHYLSKAGSKKSPEIDLEALIHFTEGSSPADLEEIVREASMDCGSRKALIDTAALNRASERMIIGNTDESTTAGREAERELIALHEAGHFLADAMRHCGKDLANIAQAKGKVSAVKISLKANARSGALGFVLRRPSRSLLQTKADIEWEARMLYGGMANEEIFFGSDGVTTGAYGDIQQATKLLSRAVRDMGMFKSGKINLSALDSPTMRSEINAEDRVLMERESQRLFDEAKAMLLACKEASRMAADLLISKGEISSDHLIDALAQRFGAELSSA